MTYSDLKLRRLPISGGMIPTRFKLLKFLLNQMMVSSKGIPLGYACINEQRCLKFTKNNIMHRKRRNDPGCQLITFNASNGLIIFLFHKLEKQHA